MSDKYFRVLLDVTDLYLEDFKYVWINVSPRELKTISDFKKYVLHKINLEGDVQLFVRDGLLLEEETIVVLREDDTVKIKYKVPVCRKTPKESLRENANSSRKRNLSESNASNEDIMRINSKRYKPEAVPLTCNGDGKSFVEKKSKKEKRKKQEFPVNSENNNTVVEEIEKQKELPLNSENSCSIAIEKGKKQTESYVNLKKYSDAPEESHKKNSKKNRNKSSIVCDQTVTDINFCSTDSFYSFNAECTPEKQNKNNKRLETVLLKSGENSAVILNSDRPSKDELDYHQNESSIVITDINSEELNNKNRSRPKRKRHRKRKRTGTNVTDSSDIPNVTESILENVDENINRKHVLYLSPDENQENKNCSGDPRELVNPSAETFVLKDDKITYIQTLDYPKMSTPTQPKNCGVPDWQVSIMASKNDSLVKNAESNENGSVLHEKSTSVTSESNRENKSVTKSYDDLPDITSFPVVGTHIAYKVLELNDNYNPAITDYREGVVEKINPDTEEIDIRLHKEIILPGRCGKFENLKQDEVPEDIVKSHDVLKWCEIISPKLLSHMSD